MPYRLSQPEIEPEDIAAVVEVLKSPSLALGPKLVAFEKAVAEYAGTAHAVAVNSGTSALHLAIRALDIGEGDEVITSPYSFVSSANCALFERAAPKFVDIDPVTLNLDAAKIEKAITKKTKAILPVHIFGQPCDMKAILGIAKKHKLAVIEDACEAIGATYEGRKAGTFGNVGTFAFYPNKQMTTGEGGILVTDDARHCGTRAVDEEPGAVGKGDVARAREARVQLSPRRDVRGARPVADRTDRQDTCAAKPGGGVVRRGARGRFGRKAAGGRAGDCAQSGSCISRSSTEACRGTELWSGWRSRASSAGHISRRYTCSRCTGIYSATKRAISRSARTWGRGRWPSPSTTHFQRPTSRRLSGTSGTR